LPFFRFLDEISLQDLKSFGGKAAQLGEARRLGCPVVPGVALATDLYARFMEQGGLKGEIASILSAMQPETMAQFQAAAWAIASAARARRVPDDVVEAIREAWETLAASPIVVRSSATNEDSPRLSFVGQHDSFLDIETFEDCLDAVVHCWISLFSAKALAYAYRFGVDLQASRMGVLLQPQLESEELGALSTVDPITGDPDRFILTIYKGNRSEIHQLDPYERKPGELPYWSRLRHIGLRLDEHHQAYQTIEWIISEGQVYIVRIRPTTSVRPFLPMCGADIGAGPQPLYLVKPPEQSPRETRPFSWYHQSRHRALNAARYRRANKLFSQYASREEYYACGYQYERRHEFARYANTKGPLRRLTVALRQVWEARTLDREYVQLTQEALSRLEELAAVHLPDLSNDALAAHLDQVMLLHLAFWAEYGALVGSGQRLKELVVKLCHTWLPDQELWEPLLWVDTKTRHDLIAFSQAIETARGLPPDKRQEALKSLWKQCRHYFYSEDILADWQDLGLVFEKEPKAFERMASFSLRTDNLEGMRAQQMAAERSMLEHLGKLKGRILLIVAALARRYLRLECDVARPPILCRILEAETVREIGRRLHASGLITDPRDAALLGCQELLEWLREEISDDAITRLVIHRRQERRKQARYTPPQEMRGMPVEEPLVPQDSVIEILRGQAISPGQTIGRARVIESLSEANNVLADEILVCPEPLFELSPLFNMISAIVTEKGGLLDHAAALVREYGLPAVFGIEQATKRIRTGDIIAVDATKGKVLLHTPQIDWESL